jgi:hypothetical protein
MIGEAALIAITTAALGAAGAMYAAWRSSRTTEQVAGHDAKVNHSVALLTGYDAFAQRLTEEVDATRARCDQQIAAMRSEHARERQEWERERAKLEERIELLEAKVVSLLTLGITRDHDTPGGE